MKEKELHVPKVVEHIQQKTYDRKNKKKAIPEELRSHQRSKSKRTLYTKKPIQEDTEQD